MTWYLGTITYRIMPELRGLLKNNRGPWSEGIIRFNAPFHCFRTSRSLLCRLLFVIMTSCSTSVTCPFHLLKIITCSKQWEGALKRHSHNTNSVIGSLMSLLILCILFCFFFFHNLCVHVQVNKGLFTWSWGTPVRWGYIWRVTPPIM